MIGRIVTAMRDYAQAAYPRGGSECSQSAREALLAAAQALQDSYDIQHNSAHLNRRQRSVARAAIKYYTRQIGEEETCTGSAREVCLLKVMGGEIVSDDVYSDAEQQDRSHAP